MEVKNLLNPVKPSQTQETNIYKSSKPLGAITDMLEQIYQRQPCPSTDLLQSLLRKYPVIPSLVYLRSVISTHLVVQ